MIFKALDFCIGEKSFGIKNPCPDGVSTPTDPNGGGIFLIITLSSASICLLIVNFVISPLGKPDRVVAGSGNTLINVGALNATSPSS